MQHGFERASLAPSELAADAVEGVDRVQITRRGTSSQR
jgi:hypothetical protein